MKGNGILASLALSLLLCAPAFCMNPAVEKAHQASYHILQETMAEGTMSCSATAVGPQALLTASHCEQASDDIFIDGQTFAQEAVIVGHIRDGFDHTILLVKNVTFPVYVSVIEKKPDQGDDIFTFGNPGDWVDVFQKGYVASIQFDDSMAAQMGEGKPPEILLDFQAYPGISGSGVFNTDGVLAFVVSAYHEQSDSKSAIAFASAWPLHFSAPELNKAASFTCPADPKPAPKPAPEVKK
jgi:hypothetical protein